MLSQEWAIVALMVAIVAVYLLSPTAPGTAPDYVPGIWNAIRNAVGLANVSAPASAGPDPPRVDLGIVPPSPVAGASVEVEASLSDCPRAGVNLTMDGRPISFDWLSDGSGISTAIAPAAGHHVVALGSTDSTCRASVAFDVLPAQCNGAQTQPCEGGNSCPGTQTCEGGRWGACEPAARVCQPGQRVPCSSNSCSFGLAQCNACGSGWLECRPPESYN